MHKRPLDHLLTNVLPASAEYDKAELHLTAAFDAAGGDETKFRIEANTAKRRAADVAVAIDGLADRAAKALRTSPNTIREQVSLLCSISGMLRTGCLDRVCAIANAYKHDQLDDPKHPINSDDDVLVVGAGYGVDGFGLGKFGGIEVMVHQKDGTNWKFLADVPYSIAGWIAFLKQKGATFPSDRVVVCGMHIDT
jgi:hypothetical protein